MDSQSRVAEERLAAASEPFPCEISRLDEAIRRGDELLVESLRSEESRRRSKRRRKILLLLGGIAMSVACLSAVLFLLQPAGNAAASNDADALSQSGWQLWSQHHYDEAATKFQEAVKANPHLTAAWNGLGWSLFNSGNSDDAIGAFDHVLQLEPKHPAALNGMGQACLAKNELDKAEKYLVQAAPLAPASWYGLARIYLLQGKWDDAATYAQKILDAHEAGTDTASVEAMLKAAKDHSLPEKLRKEITPVTAVSPKVAPAVSRAWVAMNHGDTVKAKSLFAEALAKNPNDSDALNGMGWLLLNTGDLDGAKTQFQSALDKNPDAAGAMNGLARVDAAQDKLDDAIAIWEKMVKQYPGVNAGTYGLADAYMTRKKFAQAVPLYEQIVAANPNDADVKQKLAQAKEAAAK
jgi:tetratricopeptide (TPR) repeat protein